MLLTRLVILITSFYTRCIIAKKVAYTGHHVRIHRWTALKVWITPVSILIPIIYLSYLFFRPSAIFPQNVLGNSLLIPYDLTFPFDRLCTFQRTHCFRFIELLKVRTDLIPFLTIGIIGGGIATFPNTYLV